jgi:ferredoxin-NADP reductase/fatty acid desaturase
MALVETGPQPLAVRPSHEPAGAQRRLPDPGEPVPQVAEPTVALFGVSLAAFVAMTAAHATGHAAAWLTVAVDTAVSFAMFTVLHDASHHAVSRIGWLNALLGRLSIPFLVPYASFSLFRYIHIEHHRNTNEAATIDPDTWASHAPWWQLPFRWATIDGWYTRIYLPRLRTRPRAEWGETVTVALLSAAGITVAAVTGNLATLAVVWLIPQRLSICVLAWWFDWLPHHGLTATQRENRYQATRIRVRWERFLTPLMFYQNYHLVHHLHPSIPFYRYIRAWRRNEEAYLQCEPAITTAWGRDISSDEYRAWRGIVSMPGEPDDEPVERRAHAVFHPLSVALVERLTDDCVMITFDVPEALREAFRFTQGQHVTVRTDLGGVGLRRQYSICAPVSSGTLRIAVRILPRGAFSSFAAHQLSPNDVLEVMTPAGRFFTELAPTNVRHYAAIAAGSGITPILSILATTLEVEPESRFTLLYGNRTAASTIFGDELAELERRHPGRLSVRHHLSRESCSPPAVRGRIDRPALAALLRDELPCHSVDEWFLCGPEAMVQEARTTLLEHGADPEHVHLELFHVDTAAARRARGARTSAVEDVTSAVTVSVDGVATSFELGSAGESILEAALRLRDDIPYSCMGGACGTCRARLCEGTVEMDVNNALSPGEVERGYVLTCQSHPTSARVVLDYDG